MNIIHEYYCRKNTQLIKELLSPTTISPTNIKKYAQKSNELTLICIEFYKKYLTENMFYEPDFKKANDMLDKS